ncbi:MAG: malto-oligosyltrehalose synthase, partial [Luteibacter sp.]
VALWLGGEAPRALPPGPVRRARERAIAVFQQATSPVAAKAVEDTAGYRYGRLLSRNEVGVDAGRMAMSVDAFHERCVVRADTLPHNLLATATHDHKRGEDLRARLAVLSEVAERWVVTAERWRVRHADFRQRADGRMAPSAGDELMLYQMLVATWPLSLSVDDTDGIERFASRIAAWQRKALREAKRWTRWTSPNEPYEDACEDFLRAILSSEVAAEFAAFAEYIATPGAANGLAQTVLRLTTPGVPDLYQGTDYWDFSLVDPDNRRPVDFLARAASLDRAETPAEALAHWRDGELKQALIARLLRARREHPELFARGNYRPLVAEGPAAAHVLAFVREYRGQRLVVAVARHTAEWLAGTSVPAIPAERWEGTSLVLPEGRWLSLFGDGKGDGGPVEAATLFGDLPVAAWIGQRAS